MSATTAIPAVSLAPGVAALAEKPEADRPHTPNQEDLAFGCPRFFLPEAKQVYVVVSSRARGVSVGVNLNPDQSCNFDCCYCEVGRRLTQAAGLAPVPVNTQTLAAELTEALTQLHNGSLLQSPAIAGLPAEMRRLAHVAISGDGEPTLCPNFSEAVESVVHLRAAGIVPFFKLVLITNSTALDLAEVRNGLRLFIRSDEIWAKLDAGTQAFMDRINQPEVPLTRVLANILQLARLRPVVIQSMFVESEGAMPDRVELTEYAKRLNELKAGGAQISLVQIYSATRPHHSRRCRHLSLRVLSEIAAFVRQMTGLRVEVF